MQFFPLIVKSQKQMVSSNKVIALNVHFQVGYFYFTAFSFFGNFYFISKHLDFFNAAFQKNVPFLILKFEAQAQTQPSGQLYLL